VGDMGGRPGGLRFRDIPQYTRSASYEVDVSWPRLEQYLEHLAESSLDLDPVFQRPHVWTLEQQVAYVEHVLRGGWASRLLLFNCPRWHQGGKGIVLVDGKQRLEAVRRFMRNDLPVFGGYRLRDFDGSMDVLTASFRVGVNDLPETEDVLRWYLELNSGGTPHTSDEISRVRGMLGSASRRQLPPEHEQAGREFPRPGEVVRVYGLEEADVHAWYPYLVVKLSEEGDPVVLCHGVEVKVYDPFAWKY